MNGVSILDQPRSGVITFSITTEARRPVSSAFRQYPVSRQACPRNHQDHRLLSFVDIARMTQTRSVTVAGLGAQPR